MTGDELLFFLHVPKTAGATLREILEKQFDETDIARWLYPFRLIDTPPEFFTEHRYFHGHVEYDVMCRFLARPPVTLTMLRDPLEQYLSQFGNHKRVSLDQIPDWVPEVFEEFQRTSLEQFVHDPPPVLLAEAASWQNKHARMFAGELLRGPGVPLREIDPFCRPRRQVVPAPPYERARERLEQFAFFGITERFQESLFLLAYTFGWNPTAEFEVVNDAPKGLRPYREDLASDLVEEIRRLSATDRKLYDHAHRIFDRRYEQMGYELLELYGRAEHAQLKPPLRGPVLVELLDAHYRRRFIERNPAVTSVRLGFAEKISGQNWQTREGHGTDTIFRWSGPGRCSTIDLPITATSAVLLRCSVLMAITPEVLSGMIVRVNDEPIMMEHQHRSDGGAILEGVVPKEVVARQPGCMRVTFDLVTTVRPIDVFPGNVDARSLGIGLDGVEVSAMTEQSRMRVDHENDRPASLLFFFAYGHRSGSEVALYEFIRHADRRNVRMGVACWQDGPLLKALPSDVVTFNYRNDPSLSDEEAVRRIHDQFLPDAWYINTIVQPRIMRLARSLNVRCILHTHELEEPLEVLSPEDLELLAGYPHLVIATSHGAAEVMHVLGRDQAIEVCHAPIDVTRIRSTPERALEIREQLGVGADDFLWVMSGTHNHRKDPSLFVDVASQLAKETDRARFLWVGETKNAYSIFVKEKARRLGLTRKLRWIPPQTERYHDYLNAADGFVMTSRAESLGLVLLEAAALGKPIVSFNSEGPREILRPGMGLLAEGAGAPDLVSAMMKVMQGEVDFDPAIARRRAADFDISNQGKRWQTIIKGYLGMIRRSAIDDRSGPRGDAILEKARS